MWLFALTEFWRVNLSFSLRNFPLRKAFFTLKARCERKNSSTIASKNRPFSRTPIIFISVKFTKFMTALSLHFVHWRKRPFEFFNRFCASSKLSFRHCTAVVGASLTFMNLRLTSPWYPTATGLPWKILWLSLFRGRQGIVFFFKTRRWRASMTYFWLQNLTKSLCCNDNIKLVIRLKLKFKNFVKGY